MANSDYMKISGGSPTGFYSGGPSVYGEQPSLYGKLNPGNYPKGPEATRIAIARAQGRAAQASRLAQHRLAVKNAAAQSNPKFLMAKGVKPLPGIANMPPNFKK
jgi:hypothetical protein